MFRPFVVGMSIVAASLLTVVPASAQPGALGPALKSPALQTTEIQYRRAPYGARRFRHDRRGFPVGAGIAAGIAAGALLGGALSAAGQPAYADAPEPGLPIEADADEYCASRFRSYDPSSGTYMGFDGARHPCP